jgi:hypothetical protein
VLSACAAGSQARHTRCGWICTLCEHVEAALGRLTGNLAPSVRHAQGKLGAVGGLQDAFAAAALLLRQHMS